MKFRIPFTFGNLENLKKKSRFLLVKSRIKKEEKLDQYLQNADLELTSEEYKAIRTRSFILIFTILYVVSTALLLVLRFENAFIISFLLALLFSVFTFFSQTVYPKIFDTRRVKDIEKNLIPALDDMMIQLNSGIPLFNIIVNLSSSNYGELSNEFKKASRKINAGFPEITVLEELGERNSSPYFKRTLWQLSNGMRAGSNIAVVIKESIKSLNEEQILQIQTYGNKLNPLIMFYLIMSVIIPALSITFLTILSSMLSLERTVSISLFIGLFVFVILIQIMFLGTMKSIRPSLL